ncbi:MAG: SocA family protein [Alphaproteobacteria bacterium]|nr:SocA family protein [Alphaproteobacteria bacterium]
MMASRKRLTYRVDLPGGQLRLREMVLYVAEQCADARRFGKIKLNKIIWKADFDAYAARKVPVTGRAYQRLKFGPAPVEMAPLYGEMLQDGLITITRVDLGDNYVEHRTVPSVKPEISRFFSEDDISFVRSSIDYYWELTGEEASDDSHGVAWRSRADGDPMPYELALLSDVSPSDDQARRILDMAEKFGWNSR